VSDPARLRAEARAAVEDRSNWVGVSSASVWELAIKSAQGKLRIDFDLRAAVESAAFASIPVTVEHAAAVAELPLLHRDPFDRMLVVQARIEGLTIVTRDIEIEQYDVPVLAA